MGLDIVEIAAKNNKKTRFLSETGFFVSLSGDGGDKRDRTADLLNAIQALSQLSYTPRYIDKFILTTKYIIRNMLRSVKKKIKNAVKILSQCVAQRQIIVPHIIVMFGQKCDCFKAICEKFFLSFFGKSITME